MSINHSAFLVETDWLEKNISHPDLKVIDFHYNLDFKDTGEVILSSGFPAWKEAHIPGSIYIDLLTELSDRSNPVPFMMPPIEQFVDVMSRNGIRQGKTVVIYDRGESAWAARLWWMLRSNGFDDAVILNGGWEKWKKEGRETTSVTALPVAGCFTANPRPELIVDKDYVLNSIGGEQVRVCSLGREIFRKGHIPKSVNLESMSLLRPESGEFLPEKDLERIVAAQGFSIDDEIIVYCGGGISASLSAFVLTMLGFKNVRLYDGSLEEWRADPNLPLETLGN